MWVADKHSILHAKAIKYSIVATMEKSVQVSVKLGKSVKKNIVSQTYLSCFNVKDAETQYGPDKGSYNRSSKVAQWNYDRLKDDVLCNKENIISWCIKEGLIAGERTCGHCNV